MTKILVVDDEHDAADNLAFLLEALGHEVRVGYDGAEALPLAAAFVPHIIFLDLVMPVLDGLTAARQIRAASPVTDHPFIVALTGMPGLEIERQTKSAGIDMYLLKPVDFGVLLMIIDNLKAREHPTAPKA